MATSGSATQPSRKEKRQPLTRERIIDAALVVADETGGAGTLTIRSLAQRLGGVQPMAVYHHFANKGEILDGILDRVFSEIDLPQKDGDWREEMVRRAHSARTVLRRHPWSIALLQSGTTPGPATLGHHDATLGTLRQAGFSVPMVAHAYALLDSYIYGFVLSETSLPINGPRPVAEVATAMTTDQPLDDYPHVAEFATQHVMAPGYDFGQEFDYGLTVILDGLAARVQLTGR